MKIYIHTYIHYQMKYTHFHSLFICIRWNLVMSKPKCVLPYSIFVYNPALASSLYIYTIASVFDSQYSCENGNCSLVHFSMLNTYRKCHWLSQGVASRGLWLTDKACDSSRSACQGPLDPMNIHCLDDWVFRGAYGESNFACVGLSQNPFITSQILPTNRKIH